jgi:hypothetical protein
MGLGSNGGFLALPASILSTGRQTQRQTDVEWRNRGREMARQVTS